jgi:hypothetical protein
MATHGHWGRSKLGQCLWNFSVYAVYAFLPQQADNANRDLPWGPGALGLP